MSGHGEATPLPGHNIPYLRDYSTFVSRPELDVLNAKLVPGRRVAIAGLGGSGKSQLAIEHCYRLQEKQRDIWIFWIHASNAKRYDQDIRKLAERVRLPGLDDPQTNIHQCTYDWLCNCRTCWVIVLDSADETNFLFDIPSAATDEPTIKRTRLDSLPICSQGSILITTRDRQMLTRIVDPADIINLQPNASHGTALLRRKLESVDTVEARGSTDEPIEALAAALDYMPLAVAQAAAYINERAPLCSVTEYLGKLKKGKKQMIRLLKSASPELRRDFDAKDSILLTWQISFDRIFEARRSAADLLCLMSFYDHQAIPNFLLKADISNLLNKYSTYADQNRGADDRDKSRLSDGLVQHDSLAQQIERLENMQPSDDKESCSSSSRASSETSADDSFDDDIVMLRNYSFVAVTPNGTSFSTHRLVQIAVQMWVHQTQLRKAELQSLLKLDAAYPVGRFENWATCRTLEPHAAVLLNRYPTEICSTLALASISHHVATFRESQGLYMEAASLVQRSATIRMEVLGDRHESTIEVQLRLGHVLKVAGEYEQGQVVLRAALKTAEEELGEEDELTIGIMADLSHLLYVLHLLDEAEALIRRAIRNSNELLGSSHQLTSRCKRYLAHTLVAQNKYSEAEQLYLDLRERSTKIAGQEHLDTLAMSSSLASLYAIQRRWQESEDLLLRVLKVQKRLLGEKHANTLQTELDLAWLWSAQARWAEAESMSASVYEVSMRMHGAKHESTRTALSLLSTSISELGRYAEAEKLQTELLQAQRSVLGLKHPKTLGIMHNLAYVHWKQAHLLEAKEMAEECLRLRKALLGTSHVHTQSILLLLVIIEADLTGTED